jgi:hypothetical protein
MRDGKAGEDRHQQDLQQVAARERADEGVRNDIHQVGGDTLLAGARHVGRDRLGVEGSRIDVEADARLQNLAHQQPDDERQRGHRLEIEQRLDADPADLLEVAHRSDAVHHGAENHRRDHHLDHRDEGIA